MSTHLVVIVIQCLVSLLSACLRQVLGLKYNCNLSMRQTNIQLLLALYKYLLHMEKNYSLLVVEEAVVNCVISVFFSFSDTERT